MRVSLTSQTSPISVSFYSIVCFCRAMWGPPRLPSEQRGVGWENSAGGLGHHAVRNGLGDVRSRSVDIIVYLFSRSYRLSLTLSLYDTLKYLRNAACTLFFDWNQECSIHILSWVNPSATPNGHRRSYKLDTTSSAHQIHFNFYGSHCSQLTGRFRRPRLFKPVIKRFVTGNSSY